MKKISTFSFRVDKLQFLKYKKYDYVVKMRENFHLSEILNIHLVQYKTEKSAMFTVAIDCNNCVSLNEHLNYSYYYK